MCENALICSRCLRSPQLRMQVLAVLFLCTHNMAGALTPRHNCVPSIPPAWQRREDQPSMSLDMSQSHHVGAHQHNQTHEFEYSRHTSVDVAPSKSEIPYSDDPYLERMRANVAALSEVRPYYIRTRPNILTAPAGMNAPYVRTICMNTADQDIEGERVG